MSLTEIFQYESFIRAMIASSAVGIVCGILGPYIVLRNMSLIGDALSHAVLPGVVVAFMLFDYNTVGFFGGAVIAGMISAVAITWIQQQLPTKNDAAIGIVFTVMFALGVMGISRLSKNHGAHIDLKDFLFGNVLGVSDADLWMTCTITLAVIVAVIIFYRSFFISTFQPTIAKAMGIRTKLLHYFLMLLLSLAVVASLQTVGVILVVALLIAPPSTALLLTNRLHHVIILSAGLGLIAALSGMYGAIQLETTPGPAMAVVAGIFFMIAAFFAPDHGWVSKRWIQYRQMMKTLEEDVLKIIVKSERALSVSELAVKLANSEKRLQSVAASLRRRRWLEWKDDRKLGLTSLGHQKASRLVRAHRLWETYLVNELGLDPRQIHEDAENYEHLLTDELLDEMDKQLGHPEIDPHGSPIPSKDER